MVFHSTLCENLLSYKCQFSIHKKKAERTFLCTRCASYVFVKLDSSLPNKSKAMRLSILSNVHLLCFPLELLSTHLTLSTISTMEKGTLLKSCKGISRSHRTEILVRNGLYISDNTIKISKGKRQHLVVELDREEECRRESTEFSCRWVKKRNAWSLYRKTWRRASLVSPTPILISLTLEERWINYKAWRAK